MQKPSRSALLMFGLLAGCYQENLPIADLKGKVRIPKEASQITLSDEATGTEYTIDDPRALGPVYLGSFPSVRTGDFDYSHPEMGPVLTDDLPGNTYPYGGSTVGRFDWACYQSLICKVPTGRFESFDDIIEYFNSVVLDPIKDSSDQEVTNAEAFQERCYDALYVTSDDELAFLNDGLHFELEGDEYVADAEILHSKYAEGMAVWGWMDAPSRTYEFATCDSTYGWLYDRYSEYYYTGTNYYDVLNYPSLYIDLGDWIAEDGVTITDPDQEFDLTLGYKYVDE